MFWYGFNAAFAPLSVLLDILGLIFLPRLMRRALWRNVIRVFLALEMAGMLVLVVSSDFHVAWHRQLPTFFSASLWIWHLFGVFILLPFFLLAALVWLVKGARRKTADNGGNKISRRDFVGATAALAPALCTLGFTGFAVSRLNDFRVRKFTLPLPGLPRALDGATIAHVTDTHLGTMTRPEVLWKMVDTTNAMRADLILLTGDLINYELSDLSEAMAMIRKLDAKSGVWMIEGNHDLMENGTEFQRRVRESRMPYLYNESTMVRVRGCPVELMGLGWVAGLKSQQISNMWLRDLVKKRRSDAFPILMSHHPHIFDTAAELDLPLTLAGHTHGGQLMFDSQTGAGPIFFRYWSGLYQKRRSRMIVSNGVGNCFPLRINAPAEIVHITLKSAQSTV